MYTFLTKKLQKRHNCLYNMYKKNLKIKNKKKQDQRIGHIILEL